MGAAREWSAYRAKNVTPHKKQHEGDGLSVMVFLTSPEEPHFRTYLSLSDWVNLSECVESSVALCNTFDEVRLRDGNVRHNDCIIIASYLHGRSGPSEWGTSAGAGF